VPSSEIEGLRTRKKKQTRQSIATAADRLFKRRGFDNVRMIDIAAAADVSEQTLYNYFPTKEHLIFDQDQDFEARLISVVQDRSPGVSLAQAVRAGALIFLSDITRNFGQPTGLPESVIRGPALRRIWVEMNARHAGSVAEALMRQSPSKMPRAVAKVLARAIVALFAVILEEVGESALACKTRAQIRRELRPQIEALAAMMRNIP